MDETFLEIETPTMHMHVVGVVVLEPPSDAQGGSDPWTPDRVRDTLAHRLHLIPPFRWRLVEGPGGLGPPRWMDDPDFDISRHVRRASLPAGAERFVRLVADVAEQPLRRDRPLWEMLVVDGLADGHVALVTKVHHALMDGGASGDLMAALFDLDPAGDHRHDPLEPWAPPPAPGSVEVLVASATDLVARATRLPATLAHTATGVAGMIRRSIDRAPGPAHSAGVGPNTVFNGPLTARREVAFARCAVADVKAVKREFGVTVNDVVLAAVAGSLRGYLADRGPVPDKPLTAAVPISVRLEGEDGYGNHTSNLFVALPVHLADPVERLHEAHAAAAHAKETHRTMGPNLLEEWASLAPGVLVRAGARAYSALGLARFHPPVINLVVSNVPGPPFPLFMAGARVRNLYPFGPLMDGAGLNVTVFSQGEDLDIGVIACPDLVDDPGAVAQGVADAVAELLAAAGERAEPE